MSHRSTVNRRIATVLLPITGAVVLVTTALAGTSPATAQHLPEVTVVQSPCYRAPVWWSTDPGDPPLNTCPHVVTGATADSTSVSLARGRHTNRHPRIPPIG